MAMFRIAAALSALSAASAGDIVPTADISATSKLGNRILSSARRLDDNQFTWVTGYSLKFHKCATSDEYFGGFGGDNDNNNNRNFNGMYKQRLVHFKLCPSDDCDSCKNGADYVIDMNMYVEAYLESKLEAQEYNCEMVRENCYCDNANDDEACERNCYYEAGLDYCGDNDNNNNNQNQNQIEFNLEEAAECRELEVDDEALQYYYYQQNGNGNNQYYNQQQQGGQEMRLFMGPYCSANGKYIHLGVFMDEMCSYAAPDGTYEKFSYGQAMPFSTESLIDAGCVSCKEPQDANDQNNGDQEDEDEVLEVCERLYEDAGKCESGLAAGTTYYPNTYACDFIQTLKAPGKMAGASKGSVSAAKVFAGLFAATTVLFAGVAYFLYQKAKRQNVHLSGQDGGAMA